MLVDEADDGPTEQDEPDGGRDGEQKGEAQSAREHRAEIGHVFLRGHARDEREGDGAERDAEEPERELHKAKRDAEPVRGAILQPAREPAVDHHVHLHGTRRDDRGTHLPHDLHHALVAPVPIEAEAIAEFAQRGDLHGKLQRAADERADGEADERARAELRVDPPRERHAADDGADVKERRRHRGDAEDVARIQDAHHLRAERDEDDEGEHNLREQHGEIELRGILLEAGDGDRKQVRREQHAARGDDDHRDEQQRADFVREPPRRGLAFGRDLFGKRGDERGRERPLGEEIA